MSTGHKKEYMGVWLDNLYLFMTDPTQDMKYPKVCKAAKLASASQDSSNAVDEDALKYYLSLLGCLS